MTNDEADCWILIDPVQDYEESAKVFGVFATEEAVVAALPRFRKMEHRNGSFPSELLAERHLDAEHWIGTKRVAGTRYYDDGRREEDPFYDDPFLWESP